MNNLFSVFDPSINFLGLSSNWISVSMVMIFIPTQFWLSKNQMNSSLKLILSSLKNEFSQILGRMTTPGILPVILGIFTFIFLNNFLGLFPYTFTATSHLSVTMSLSLPIWLGYNIISLLKSTSYYLAHLVPQGTPTALLMFMVLIEVISSLMRPLTLAIRLMANITAGHLLMVLLSGLLSTSIILTACMGWALILLIGLELMVAMIQAYVFSLLLTLYISEMNIPSSNV